MPLKQLESYPAGGVSSRDNPISYPLDRYLRMANFWPQQDGSVRLRDGYTLYAQGLSGVPIHSIIGVVGPGPAYARLIVFWQGKIPYILDPATKGIIPATVRGATIRTSDRFCYFCTPGKLYAFNGTDSKWFDGVVWRDVGLPRLTADQVANVVVAEGLHSISSTDAAAVTLTPASGGAWGGGNDVYGELFYLAFFDTSTNQVMGSTIALGAGGARKKLTTGQKLNLANLPTSATANIVKLFGKTQDGGSSKYAHSAHFIGSGGAVVLQGTKTIHRTTLAPHGLATGDVVAFNLGTDTEVATSTFPGPFSVSVIDSLNFTFDLPEVLENTPGNIANSYGGICYVLLVAASGSTATSIDSNDGDSYVNGLVDKIFSDSSVGLAASTIASDAPGYQFYASIRNRVTQHVGNRRMLGGRLVNLSRANAILAGYPDISLIDDEWELLLGRTGDGAQIPYAMIDNAGDFIVTVPGQTSTTIAVSDIDGDTELPARNFPPPGTLDFNQQIAPDAPIIGTFKRAWVESDHCCGALEGQPTVYRSGSAQDSREGKFVGLPEQSWSPADIETFPTAAPISGGHGYSGESLIFSKEDSATLIELAGETGWQGPYNIGGAGQFAYAKGWKNLPFSLTGEKQLATGSPDGPTPISDEYEQTLLSKIGDRYLGDAEIVPVRLPHKRVDVLRISARDKTGAPFTIIHDFNLRDNRSPYGQAYEEDFLGPLGPPPVQAPILTKPAVLVRLNGIVTATITYNIGDTIPTVLPGFQATASDSTNTAFDGVFQVLTVVQSGGFSFKTLELTWAQSGPDDSGGGTVTVVQFFTSAPTVAAVRDENDQPLILAGASDGNLYKLYDSISDAGEFFTGEALGLRYIGPQRTAIKFLEWYGDGSAKFFVSKKLTTPFDFNQMQALCPTDDKSASELQGDEESNHYQVTVEDPEMIHAYVLLRLTGYPDSPNPSDLNNPIPSTMELNDPPHMPVETYGRVLMVSPSAGAGRS